MLRRRRWRIVRMLWRRRIVRMVHRRWHRIVRVVHWRWWRIVRMVHWRWRRIVRMVHWRWRRIVRMVHWRWHRIVRMVHWRWRRIVRMVHRRWHRIVRMIRGWRRRIVWMVHRRWRRIVRMVQRRWHRIVRMIGGWRRRIVRMLRRQSWRGMRLRWQRRIVRMIRRRRRVRVAVAAPLGRAQRPLKRCRFGRGGGKRVRKDDRAVLNPRALGSRRRVADDQHSLDLRQARWRFGTKGGANRSIDHLVVSRRRVSGSSLYAARRRLDLDIECRALSRDCRGQGHRTRSSFWIA